MWNEMAGYFEGVAKKIFGELMEKGKSSKETC